WGKFRRLEGGDMMHARGLVREGRRDASYVRYTALIDRHERRQNHPEELVAKDFYGQLRLIIVIPIPASGDLRQPRPETIALAVIRPAKAKVKTGAAEPLSIPGPIDVVDLQSLQCVVGRVRHDHEWALVDRSEPL
ncbi:hypothetical protein BV25DRAFT_1770760, partial [Artomyces pyxidatus]